MYTTLLAGCGPGLRTGPGSKWREFEQSYPCSNAQGEEKSLHKHFYILFVGRDGQLCRVQIPIFYLCTLLVVAVISLTGIVNSYSRVQDKVSRFNELRSEKEALAERYSRLEQVDHEKDIEVTALASLASEVSVLYGLKPNPILTSVAVEMKAEQVDMSIEQLYALKNSALTGATSIGVSLNSTHALTMADWLRASAASPAVWPVVGRITGAFGKRTDPFNGEGAFHRGVDISAAYGEPVVAPADGQVVYADFINGYGRTTVLKHGHGMTTLYGHLASFAVIAGQEVRRGDVIGYVGLSGRSTGPHLHYEVRINDVPVNPHKYLHVMPAHRGSTLVDASTSRESKPKSQPRVSQQISIIPTQNSAGTAPTSDKSTGLPRITGIRHWSSSGASTVVLNLRYPVHYEAHRLTGPDRIYFDLHDVTLVPGLSDKTIEIHDALLVRVRVAQRAEGITRMVLETSGPPTYSVSFEQNPCRLVVQVRRATV
jgi:murein DD-endopeptidase MepM/ murein hydrolase activator NlpD